MTLLTRFFLLLCFLPLQRHVHAHDHRTHPLVTRDTRANGQINRPKAIELEEEDDSYSSKKCPDIHTCCFSFLDIRSPRYIYSDLRVPLPFCEHFSWFSSFKFIIHRVLRI